jgi:DNA-directed RNA polymerase specialized sigma24 family protein
MATGSKGDAVRVPERRRYVLDEDSLRRLLQALDPDPGRASERYEALRQRLVRVFVWEHVADAEALADETLDRVARRMHEGVTLLDVAAYAHRIAELLLLEARRTAIRRDRALGDPAYSAAASAASAHEIERRHACLEGCLGQLTPDQRGFILRYYAHEGRARIEVRDALAREYGIPLSALRNRALRLREKLEVCITACLGGQDGSAGSDTEE